MLDIQFISDNLELVAEKSKQKGYEVDVKKLLEVYKKRSHLIQELERANQKRNQFSNDLRKGQPTPEQIEKGKELRVEHQELSKSLADIDSEFEKLLKAVPNMPLGDVPVGASEEDNQVAKKVGEPKSHEFTPKNHWELATAVETIDKPRAAKISGSRFVYLKGGLVQLQFAIISWVMQTLTNEQVIRQLIEENNLNIVAKPFTPVLPPALVNTKAYLATTRLDAEEMTYKLADDELWLNASAEHSLCNMYMDEILLEAELPIRYLGYVTSFRREAGTYGKDTEGIIRMHQFDKMEMEVFSTPETGLDEHKLLIAIEEYLVQQLDLPYQVLIKCTADIGKANARGVDIEVWFPGQGKYRETHTADYMTDYQARSLKTRVRRNDGQIQPVHNNDATAFALTRILAAIMENYQTGDGRVIVPEVLRSFMVGKNEI